MTFELQLSGRGLKNFARALRANDTILPPQTELPSTAYDVQFYAFNNTPDHTYRHIENGATVK